MYLKRRLSRNARYEQVIAKGDNVRFKIIVYCGTTAALIALVTASYIASLVLGRRPANVSNPKNRLWNRLVVKEAY